MLELAQEYANLLGTQVIAHAFKDDGSITFVLESGPKLNMTEEQLREEIAKLKPAEEPEPVKTSKKKGK